MKSELAKLTQKLAGRVTVSRAHAAITSSIPVAKLQPSFAQHKPLLLDVLVGGQRDVRNFDLSFP